MNYRLITFLAAASVISLSVSACSKKSSDAVASDGATDTAIPVSYESAMGTESASASGATVAADSHAAQFLTDGMKGDNSEVKLGKLAAEMGSTPAVRSLGQMLAADHTKHAADLASLGATMGVSKTDATTSDGDAAYARLKGLSGAAFDKEYAALMVKNHKAGIAKNQAEANSNDPAALRDLATKTLPTLKKHLAAAEALAS